MPPPSRTVPVIESVEVVPVMSVVWPAWLLDETGSACAADTAAVTVATRAAP